MINWYELPHKTALGLILVIARSSNVMKMTAGKLFHLSIATFGDVSNMYYIYNVRTRLIKIFYILYIHFIIIIH